MARTQARTRRTSIAGPVLFQSDLARLRQLQIRAASLAVDLAEAKKELVKVDGLVQVFLGTPGAVIEAGPLTAAVKVDLRRNIPWKSVCVERLGKRVVDAISAEWPQDEIRHVIVTEIPAANSSAA
jgi:hypothetical protein